MRVFWKTKQNKKNTKKHNKISLAGKLSKKGLSHFHGICLLFQTEYFYWISIDSAKDY